MAKKLRQPHQIIAVVGEELVRISVGLEAAGDILDDLDQALRAAQKA